MCLPGARAAAVGRRARSNACGMASRGRQEYFHHPPFRTMFITSTRISTKCVSSATVAAGNCARGRCARALRARGGRRPRVVPHTLDRLRTPRRLRAADQTRPERVPAGPRSSRRSTRSGGRCALPRRRACRAGRRGSRLRCPSSSTSRAGSAPPSAGGRASARSRCSRELCCSSSVVRHVRGGVARA